MPNVQIKSCSPKIGLVHSVNCKVQTIIHDTRPKVQCNNSCCHACQLGNIKWRHWKRVDNKMATISSNKRVCCFANEIHGEVALWKCTLRRLLSSSTKPALPSAVRRVDHVRSSSPVCRSPLSQRSSISRHVPS